MGVRQFARRARADAVCNNPPGTYCFDLNLKVIALILHANWICDIILVDATPQWTDLIYLVGQIESRYFSWIVYGHMACMNLFDVVILYAQTQWKKYEVNDIDLNSGFATSDASRMQKMLHVWPDYKSAQNTGYYFTHVKKGSDQISYWSIQIWWHN